MHLVGCDGAAISLFDPSGDVDVVYATDATALHLSELAVGYESADWAAMASRHGASSFLSRPIDAAGGHRTGQAGVLQVYSRQQNMFDASTDNTLAICADMASEALQDRGLG